ncbi:hypothetical protein HDU96_009720 [Phlyctochytrium bullatum]|nr:hypothetical protein HDU96_009720 [Phlyctochytrium bullatum]
METRSSTANGASGSGGMRLKIKPISGAASSKAPTEPTIALDDDDGTEAHRGKSGKGYLWEEEYKRSWDVLQEDEKGSLEGVVASIVMQKRRRLQTRDTRPIQRGIIRHLCLIVDLSRSMGDPASAADHLRPSKLECALGAAETFVGEFFDANPLGSLCVLAMRDGVVKRVSEMGGNPSEHIAAMQKRENREPSGEASLQNALEMARAILVHVPSHGTREVLLIFGSLTTCDPGDIFATLTSLVADRIRVSIVGLTAEMKICRTICQKTRGTYTVVLGDQHLRETVTACVPPPPVVEERKKDGREGVMIQMGFPPGVEVEPPNLCICHGKPVWKGYTCPRCQSLVCELPADCPVCQLTLVSAPLLARSYHHLFPVPNYKEVLASANPTSTECSGCHAPFPPVPTFPIPRRPSSATAPDAPGGGARPSSANTPFPPDTPTSSAPTGRFECERCRSHFCLECDLFAHEVLHNCAGCAARAATSLPLMGEGFEGDGEAIAYGVAGRRKGARVQGEMEALGTFAVPKGRGGGELE